MSRMQKIIIIILIFILPITIALAAKRTVIHMKVGVENIEPSEDIHWELIGRHKPTYSRELATSKFTGCAITSFEISESGSTKKVKIIKAVPAGKITRHLNKIMRKVKWRAVEEGSTPESQQRTLRLNFCLSKISNADVQQQCKELAKLPCE